tara:strand:+ start:351 stop:602 length:252 start_codon:yes stop_codon:yes gene_type:complete
MTRTVSIPPNKYDAEYVARYVLNEMPHSDRVEFEATLLVSGSLRRQVAEVRCEVLSTLKLLRSKIAASTTAALIEACGPEEDA